MPGVGTKMPVFSYAVKPLSIGSYSVVAKPVLSGIQEFHQSVNVYE
jgi:hypothetical protein